MLDTRVSHGLVVLQYRVGVEYSHNCQLSSDDLLGPRDDQSCDEGACLLPDGWHHSREFSRHLTARMNLCIVHECVRYRASQTATGTPDGEIRDCILRRHADLENLAML